MSNNSLYQPFTLHDLKLANRIALAPMTRSRAGVERIPNRLMAEYYAQRSAAGLLITEATTISEEANGWNESPGIYTDEMAEGWKQVVKAVHEKGGVIFLQLWHMGRASHSSFHNGKPAVAPSAIKINEPYIHTPTGKQPHEVPRALETAEIPRVVEDYRLAAQRAKAAGFDGVEVHSANGYLIDMLSPVEDEPSDGPVRRKRGKPVPLPQRSRRGSHVRLARQSSRRATVPQRVVQRHGVTGLPRAIHVRRQPT